MSPYRAGGRLAHATQLGGPILVKHGRTALPDKAYFNGATSHMVTMLAEQSNRTCLRGSHCPTYMVNRVDVCVHAEQVLHDLDAIIFTRPMQRSAPVFLQVQRKRTDWQRYVNSSRKQAAQDSDPTDKQSRKTK